MKDLERILHPAPSGWGMDADFTWHLFDNDSREALCPAPESCYYPGLGKPLLLAISEEHSTENGGQHCQQCLQLVAKMRANTGQCLNCGTGFAALAESATHTGFCHYCADNGLMPPVSQPVPVVEPEPVYSYAAPTIVSEVPRHGDSSGEPYRWNVNRVCINPDYVYQAAHGKNDDLKLLAALDPKGQWRASYSYNYASGGSSGPVSLSGPGFATKEEAIRAQAAALLTYPNIKLLHKNLRAALVVEASRTVPAPQHRKPAKAVSTQQLSLF